MAYPHEEGGRRRRLCTGSETQEGLEVAARKDFGKGEDRNGARRGGGDAEEHGKLGGAGGILSGNMQLEPRLLFDGAALAAGAEAHDAMRQQHRGDDAAAGDGMTDAPAGAEARDAGERQNTEALLEALRDVPAAGERQGMEATEIVFIDPSVEGYEQLAAGLGAAVEVVILDGDRDGVEQIASVLEGRTGVDAIHIIAHGTSGSLDLGSATLTAESITGEHADKLATISEALSARADILIYGCDFAAGETGTEAVWLLAEATGADVAASDDLTGAAALGGDWELEVSSGRIDVQSLALTGYAGTLADSDGDGVDDATDIDDDNDGIPDVVEDGVPAEPVVYDSSASWESSVISQSGDVYVGLIPIGPGSVPYIYGIEFNTDGDSATYTDTTPGGGDGVVVLEGPTLNAGDSFDLAITVRKEWGASWSDSDDVTRGRFELLAPDGSVVATVDWQDDANNHVANNDANNMTVNLTGTATVSGAYTIRISDNGSTSTGLRTSWADDWSVVGIRQVAPSADASTAADTDGDGIPNSLDIDSDNDGITDLIEAQSTAGYVAPTGLDSDGDGLDDAYETDGLVPVDTDGDGTPDYQDADSDNDGVADSVESGLGSASGTDANGDGLDDAFAGTTPADLADTDGDLNGDPATAVPTEIDFDYRDTVAAAPPAADTDGDGIPDDQDLDADNDGILNVDEGLDYTLLPDPDFSATPIGMDGADIANPQQGDQFLYRNVYPGIDAIVTIEELAGGTTIAQLDTTDLGQPEYFQPVINHVAGGYAQFSIQFVESGTSTPIPPDTFFVTSIDNDGYEIVAFDETLVSQTLVDDPTVQQLYDGYDGYVGFIASGVSQAGIGDAPEYQASAVFSGTSVIRFRISNDGSGTRYHAISISPTTIFSGTTAWNSAPVLLDEMDSDSDGIADYLDLDSDNDGISDLAESGQDATAVDADNDGRLDGDVDADGVPLAAAGGVTPVDSDANGVTDFRDLDADGDGIPDIVEAQPTDGYVPASATVEADGTNASGLFVPQDTDGDGTADWLDTDSDDDGIADADESGLTPGTDANADGIGDGIGASYLDPDGIVNDPAAVLANEVGDASEVAYRENAALLQDSDGDGIPDVQDLDDDNDGILDVNEGPAAASVDLATFTGWNTDTITGSINGVQISLTLGNGVIWQEGTGVFAGTAFIAASDPLTVPVTITFSEPLAELELDLIGLKADVGGVEQLTNFSILPDGASGGTVLTADNTIAEGAADAATSTTGSVHFTLDGADTLTFDYVRSSTTYNVGFSAFSFLSYSSVDTDGDGIANTLDVDSDNDGIPDLVESGQDGATLDADNDGRLDGEVDADGVPVAAAGGVTPVDADGDGIIDTLDLDADADGIPDAVEAQLTIGYAAPDGTTLQRPVDTDGDGTADYLDTDSDDDGLTDAEESGLVPGADADGDGIGDGIGASYADPDGIVNDPAAVLANELGDASEVAYRENAALLQDSDSDGIPDVQDLDDDNDGVLDVDEGLAERSITEVISGVDFLDYNDGTPVSGSMTYAAYESSPDAAQVVFAYDGVVRALNSGGTKYSSFEFYTTSSTPGSNLGQVTYTITDPYGTTVPDATVTGNSISVWDIDGGTQVYQVELWNADPATGDLVQITSLDGFVFEGVGPGTFSIRDLGSGIFEVTYTGQDPAAFANDNARMFFSSVGDDLLGRIRITGIESNVGGDYQALTTDRVVEWTETVDTDGDGVADHLDLDSDGDGLSDLVESGQEASVMDTDGDGRVDGDVDADGVPVAANGGVTVPDTDGDGVSDRLDLDSDGDGIPDAVEAVPTAGYVSPAGPQDVDGVNATGLVSAPVDTDGDGTADYLDTDSDDDGLTDAEESGLVPGADADGDGIGDGIGASYADPDGIVNDPAADLADEIPANGEAAYREAAVDSDGDGVPDHVDLDDDNDGIMDTIENAVSVPLDGWGATNPQTFTFEQGSLTVSQSAGSLSVTQLDGVDVVKWTIDSSTFQTFTFDFSQPVTDLRTTIYDVDEVEIVKITAFIDGRAYELGPDEVMLGSSLEFNEYGNIVNMGGSVPDFSGDPSVQVRLAIDGPIDQLVISARETARGGRNFGFSNPTFVMGGKDTDGDGVPDSLDLDSDNDGISDLIESGQDASVDADNDGRRDDMATPELAAQNDLDVDGLADAVDNGSEVFPRNTDATGPADYLDLDSDDDSIPDAVEARPTAGYVSSTHDGNATNDGVNDDGLYVPVDTDGDGIADFRDTDSDDDGTGDLDEGGLPTLVGDMDGDGIDDARNASYVDPDGDVNDPSADLPNEYGDTTEVAYREGNTPPVLDADPDGSSGAATAGDYVTTWTENDAPAAIVDVADALLSDAQDDIATLTVTLVGGRAGDALIFPDTLPAGITASVSSPAMLSADGDLTVVFSGDPAATTPADWQTLLRSLTLLPSSTTPETPDPAVRTVTMQATDSVGATSNVVTATVNVVPVNDPVRVVAALPDVDAQDGSASLVVMAASAFADADGDALTYSLGADAPSWLTIDPATGVISVDGTIPASASMTTNMSMGLPGEYDITVIATDPAGTDASVSFRIRVANVLPEASDDAYEVSEDGPLTGNVLANDADGAPDGDDLVVIGVNGGYGNTGAPVTLPSGAVVTLNADGTFTYDPDGSFDHLAEGETATDTFTYTVDDDNEGQDTATVTVTLTGSNDAPVVVDPANPGDPGNPDPAPDPAAVLAPVSATDGETPAPVDASAVFVDPEGDVLTFSATGLPAGLTLDPQTGVISGTIAPDASQGGPNGDGVYEVTITAADSSGATATTSLVFTVTNPAPVAQPDTASDGEDAEQSGNVLANDADGAPDGDALTVVAIDAGEVGQPIVLEHGTLTLNADGTWTFVPNETANALDDGETATETVTYTVSDGQGGTDEATLTITLTGSDDGPTVVDPTGGSGGGTGTGDPDPAPADPDNVIPDVSATDGGTPDPIETGLYLVDPDGDPLTFSATGLPEGLSIDPQTGVISGTIAPDASQGGPNGDGVYDVTVTATDPETGRSISTTVTYTIANVAPLAADDTSSDGEDAEQSDNVLANDADGAPDTDPLTVVAIDAGEVGQPIALEHGTLTLNADGSWTFVPNWKAEQLAEGETATDTVTYTVSDGQGGTDTATLTISLTGSDDGPTIVDPTGGSGGGTGDPDPAPADPDNVIPDVAATDGETPAEINAGLYIVDPEGDPLTFTATGLPEGLTIDPQTGVISGTIAPDASQGGPNGDGVYDVTITATGEDGSSNSTSVTCTITNVAPEALPDTASGSEDAEQSGNVLANDADGAPDTDPLTVVAVDAGEVGQPIALEHGTLTLKADGSWTFVPNWKAEQLAEGETATEVVTYTVSDGQGGTDSATLTLTLLGADDGPTIVDPTGGSGGGTGTGDPDPTIDPDPDPVDPDNVIPDVAATDGETPAEINAGLYIVDPEGDPLTFTATGLPAGLTIDPQTGIISGTVAPDASQGGPNGDGVYEVIITATGIDGSSTSTTVTYTVTNVAPLAADDASSDGEDVEQSGNVLTNDADGAPDGDALTVVAIDAGEVGQPIALEHGTLTLNADGSWTFVPNAAANALAEGETAIDTVTYTVSDGQGGTDSATLAITLAGSNDGPVLVDPSDPGEPGDPKPAPDPAAVLTSVSAADGGTPEAIDTGLYLIDPEGDPLTFTATGLPEGLSIDPQTGVISGTIAPDASQGGPDGDGVHAVTVTATDPSGESAVLRFDFRVENVPPAAAADASADTEDAEQAGNVLTNDIDGAPDSDALTVMEVNGDAALVGQPVTLAHGEIVLNADGSWTFVPDWRADQLTAGELVNDAVFYRVSDGQGGTDTAILTISIVGVDDGPTVVNPNPVDPRLPDPDPADPDNVIPDVSATDGGTPDVVDAGRYLVDPEGDPLTFTATGLPEGLTIDPQTGVISGTIAPDASQGGPNGDGVYEVTITATGEDGSTTSTTVTCTITNVAPEALADNVTGGEDGVLTGNVLANDADGMPDGDPLTVVAVSGGEVGRPVALPHGDLTIAPDGSWTFVPNAAANALAEGETATDTVTYTVSDGQGGTATAMLSITLTGSDDAPVVVDPSDPGEPGDPKPAPDPDHVLPVMDLEDGQQVTGIDITGPFRDPEGGGLTYQATGLPEGLVLDPVTGVITGTLAGDASTGGPGGDGRYEVIIRATDGSGQSVETTLELQVANVPPENVARLPDVGVRNGDEVRLGTARVFVDRDGDTLTYSATGLPEGLTIDPATGLISGRVALDASRDGPYRVVVTADDGQGGTARATFLIDVTTSLVVTPESGGGSGGGDPLVDPGTGEGHGGDGGDGGEGGAGGEGGDGLGDPLAGDGTGDPAGEGGGDGAGDGTGGTGVSVTQAVEDLGDLGSSGNRGRLSVLKAVNGISHLAGLAAVKNASELSDWMDDVAGGAAGKAGAADMDGMPRGGSSLAMSLGLDGGDELVIRTLVTTDGLLAIDMSASDGRGGRTLPDGLKVFTADGRELPWNVRGNSSGTILVDIPAGREWLDLRIERPAGDGTTESWEIRVNLRSGEIVQTGHAGQRASATGFLDDVERMTEDDRRAVELLMQALAE